MRSSKPHFSTRFTFSVLGFPCRQSDLFCHQKSTDDYFHLISIWYASELAHFSDQRRDLDLSFKQRNNSALVSIWYQRESVDSWINQEAKRMPLLQSKRWWTYSLDWGAIYIKSPPCFPSPLAGSIRYGNNKWRLQLWQLLPRPHDALLYYNI